MEKLIQSVIKTLVKWTPSGAGFGVMLHALVVQDWMQAVLASFLTASSALWVSFSSKFMEEAEKEAGKRGGGLARWMFVVGDRTAIALQKRTLRTWRHVTSDFEDKYYQRLSYICRNYETQGLERDRYLKLKQVFVPLKISQKSLAKISLDLIQASSADLSKHQDIGEILMRMSRNYAFRRLAILGAPGSGKTTLLRYLTLVYTHRQQRKLLHPKAPLYIPVLIYLRDVRKDIVNNPKMPLVNFIHNWIQGLQETNPLEPPQNWVANKLEHNQFLVLLDGLDEIADETERQEVSRWVDFQMKEYPETAFILSSRPLGYNNAKLEEDVTVLEVQPFNLDQIEEFIHNWYLETEILRHDSKNDVGVKDIAHQNANDLIKRIRDNAPLATMAVNPLLLTMITTVHMQGNVLPGKRVELYKEICQVLLEKRQRAKRLTDGHLTASQKLSVLKPLAFTLMNDKTRSFSLDSKIDQLLQEKLKLLSSNVPASADFLRQMREVSGLLIAKEEGIYEFAHLSFQEYLASVEIKESNDESILIDTLENTQQLSWWAETIRLYCAQCDASKIIQAALQSDSVDTLSLAFDCLEEGLSVEPAVRERLDTRLVQSLESPDQDLFRLATEVKLSRRLHQLLRIDEKRFMDTSYITCAEYQLFIDEQRQQEKFYQPDHWDDYHFSADMATKPITGIRATDAQAFCDWLSQRTGQSYRLPDIQEAQGNPIEQSDIGAWSLVSKSKGYKIVGISAKQQQQWQSTLIQLLEQFFWEDLGYGRLRLRNLDRALVHNIAHNLSLNSFLDCDFGVLDFNRALVREGERDNRNHKLDRARASARSLGLDIALDLAFKRNLDLEFSYDLDNALINLDLGLDIDLYDINLGLEINIARDLDRDHVRSLALDIGHALDRDLARIFIRDLDLSCDRIHNRNYARTFIRAYLSFFLIILELSTKTSEQRVKEKIQQDNRDPITQQFYTTADAYLALSILHLRQKNELPSWESLRIVRDDRLTHLHKSDKTDSHS